MFTAAAEGDIELIQQLITEENVNEKDERDNTVLYYAVMFNQLETARLLLNLKADPLIKCRNGLTALHSAAENGNEKILKLLTKDFDDGFDFDTIVNNNQSSLIHSAAYGIIQGNHNCWNVIRWLINRDANPFLENDLKRTPRNILSEYTDLYDDILESLGCYI